MVILDVIVTGNAIAILIKVSQELNVIHAMNGITRTVMYANVSQKLPIIEEQNLMNF